MLFCCLFSVGCRRVRPAAPPQLVVWAWERPEDLRFLPQDVPIAVQTGFVEIAGDGFVARGRRFPLLTNAAPRIAVVHIQIDERDPPDWTPDLRRRVAAAVLHYALVLPVPEVQIDFEVRRSQRNILVDVLHDVRAGLPKPLSLSMTALASWCQEGWLDHATADEIVPMLFRMGRGDPSLRTRIEAGGDFLDPRCRHALALSADEPIARAPAGRRVYLFDPRSWTRSDFQTIRQQVERWR
ncbi:hypothetical protein [Sphingomonas abietis]|uniref:DUF3142 domain-containing protein n=1 Tax=Sphingomonas abietis TaxID=3012344 RepID=A0ABY7NU89_9SPHN|nr:hypothetical protein [Sphingomonas abietis]WBO24707.1 hypothetical protein PBT88_19645 [Sphingomonas abietis]